MKAGAPRQPHEYARLAGPGGSEEPKDARRSHVFEQLGDRGRNPRVDRMKTKLTRRLEALMDARQAVVEQIVAAGTSRRPRVLLLAGVHGAHHQRDGTAGREIDCPAAIGDDKTIRNAFDL